MGSENLKRWRELSTGKQIQNALKGSHGRVAKKVLSFNQRTLSLFQALSFKDENRGRRSCKLCMEEVEKAANTVYSCPVPKI